jgi:hypothetical protein
MAEPDAAADGGGHFGYWDFKLTEGPRRSRAGAFGGGGLRVASGIDIEEVAVGDGPVAERGQLVSIRWRGTLNRGDPFGSGEVSFRRRKGDIHRFQV